MQPLLVIGGASADILHTPAGVIASPGGAGMYTAMAAQRCGVPVSLFAPRPDPMPTTLAPVAERLADWLGPVVPPSELARFEISHRGGQTTYLKASVGAEAHLLPEALPADLSRYACVHIIPLGDPRRQLGFLQACHQRGARRISVGNAIEGLAAAPEIVRQIIEQADFCFMNEKEAAKFFGSVEQARTLPGKLLFVTLGEKGCLVIQGEHVTRLDTRPVAALDPTGAGDTFCGAALSGLIRGWHPVVAAQSAMPLAAQMTGHIGPTALFWAEEPPEIPRDGRVSVDELQVQKISRLVATLPEVRAFDFVGAEFPPAGHPAALDLFFASTLQQFGFWSIQNGRYYQPLIAPLHGAPQKGSTYLAFAYLRAMQQDPQIFTPARQAGLSEREIQQFFRAEDDTDPMPALDLHLAQARQYGRDLLALGLSPAEIVRIAQNSSAPLQTFLELLDQIGGYKEDPLRKKSNLLAMILNQRPEAFLAFGDQEAMAPIIDYHLMRSCLRVGLLDVHDAALRQKLIRREVLPAADEWAVRLAAYQAIEQVVVQSGKSTGAVDWFFFNARKRCPEMSEPICPECPVDPVCAHRKALFQPVLRTTFY